MFIIASLANLTLFVIISMSSYRMKLSFHMELKSLLINLVIFVI